MTQIVRRFFLAGVHQGLSKRIRQLHMDDAPSLSQNMAISQIYGQSSR